MSRISRRARPNVRREYHGGGRPDPTGTGRKASGRSQPTAAGSDLIPSFGTKLSMIFAKERGMVYVEMTCPLFSFT